MTLRTAVVTAITMAMHMAARMGVPLQPLGECRRTRQSTRTGNIESTQRQGSPQSSSQ